MKYYEENSAAMSEDENLDVETDVSVNFFCKRIFLVTILFFYFFFVCCVSMLVFVNNHIG